MSDGAAVGFDVTPPGGEMPTATAENSGRSASGQFVPGNQFRWKKGASPNPGGRPARPLTEALWTQLERRIPDDAEGKKLRKKFHLSAKATWLDVVACALVRRAIDDNAAAAELGNRLEGKPTQAIEVSTPRDIRIVVHYEKALPCGN
jgi:uncharacterized protein DUF5681